VDENVRTVVLLDESKTLCFVEPFNCTLSHFETPSLPVGRFSVVHFRLPDTKNHSAKVGLSGLFQTDYL
jgi:hypothetical protein